MPRLEIDKERFKQFLYEFSGDTPYQLELINVLIDDLPIQMAEGLIEELYYSKVYKGNVYKVQHCVFKDDIHYFQTYDKLLEFLTSVNKTVCEFNTDSLLTLDRKTIEKRMQQNLPICGYLIEIEEINHEEPTKTISRYEQFQ